MSPLLYIAIGVGAYLLLTGQAQALLPGLKAGGKPDDYVGRTLAEVPGEVQAQMLSINRALAGPPPKDGFLGYMYLPDKLADGSAWTPPDVLVRRSESERQHDLGWAYLPDFSWVSQSARIRKVVANGQQDWSFAGQLGRYAGPVIGIVSKV